MNYCPLVLSCALFLLVAQTVGFGIYHRACNASLDNAPPTRYTTRIIHNSGYHNVTLNDRCLNNPLEC